MVLTSLMELLPWQVSLRSTRSPIFYSIIYDTLLIGVWYFMLGFSAD